ncbi:hypothetical protein SNOG_13432 [Parastagonospora nodorum SN15]|uniref:Uncharacterized protein n=1 Tax=Phaeosphaeria nodorum (strain SN15 / ATCC MYA-4574 / FGSC 10173) TaxID=321614 RepID=Q0U482_PHANO|nr:hypothetical protein SNOG_13432 [Parastagonospora nodorum SN15]EAT79316.1 hypothetical protein SNOG_13432 [Parastagonospora nodorum SN15]
MRSRSRNQNNLRSDKGHRIGSTKNHLQTSCQPLFVRGQPVENLYAGEMRRHVSQPCNNTIANACEQRLRWRSSSAHSPGVASEASPATLRSLHSIGLTSDGTTYARSCGFRYLRPTVQLVHFELMDFNVRGSTRQLKTPKGTPYMARSGPATSIIMSERAGNIGNKGPTAVEPTSSSIMTRTGS